MIERLVQSDMAGVEVVHVRMGFSSHMNSVGRVTLAKVVHLLSTVARIIYCRFRHGARVLYYPPAGPDRVPMIRDVFILLATRWLFDKTILHFHAGGVSELYDRLPPWQRWLFRRAYFDADAAVRMSTLTPEDGKRLNAKYHYVIPYGIEDPCPSMAAARPLRDQVHASSLHILFVGVLSEAKGVLRIIEACAELASRDVSFQVDLLGQWQSDEFAARVRERIRNHGLDQQIHFLGLLVGDEKFSVFRRADVLCFPTVFNCEAFPVVVLEAMACGLPVVATRWRGIPSMVEDGVSGILVEPDDSQDVVDALAKLAQDQQLRWGMGAAGRKRFLQDYTIAIHLERMRQMFLEVGGQLLPASQALRSAGASASTPHGDYVGTLPTGG
jgi:glycosyltransferase involved in cell wall biosynthesis